MYHVEPLQYRVSLLILILWCDAFFASGALLIFFLSNLEIDLSLPANFLPKIWSHFNIL